MKLVSLNHRLSQTAATSAEVEVALFHIEHELLAEPVRLSTDNTERLTVDPLAYGTRSNWLGANKVTEPFRFVLASALVPSDLEDAPAAGNIVLENVDNDIAALLRSYTDYATVHMAVVLASSPDVLETEHRNMLIVSAEGDAGQVVLEFSRRPIEEESVPLHSFSAHEFPGLYR